MRYLFGVTGTTLTAGALGAGATRDADEIVAWLDACPDDLDVDGNGEHEALSDGLLLLRYLFGLRGDALITGAVGQGCTRCDAASIEAHIEALLL
jgi:hypothetical protein